MFEAATLTKVLMFTYPVIALITVIVISRDVRVTLVALFLHIPANTVYVCTVYIMMQSYRASAGVAGAFGIIIGWVLIFIYIFIAASFYDIWNRIFGLNDNVADVALIKANELMLVCYMFAFFLSE